MTKNRKQKKQTRARAAKTGESFTAARAARAKEKTPNPEVSAPCPHMRSDWRHCPHCLGMNEVHAHRFDPSYRPQTEPAKTLYRQQQEENWLKAMKELETENLEANRADLVEVSKSLMFCNTIYDQCVLAMGHTGDHRRVDGTRWNIGTTNRLDVGNLSPEDQEKFAELVRSVEITDPYLRTPAFERLECGYVLRKPNIDNYMDLRAMYGSAAVTELDASMARDRAQHATHSKGSCLNVGAAMRVEEERFDPGFIAQTHARDAIRQQKLTVADIEPLIDALKSINSGDLHPDEIREGVRETLEDFDKKHPKVLFGLMDPEQVEEEDELVAVTINGRPRQGPSPVTYELLAELAGLKGFGDIITYRSPNNGPKGGIWPGETLDLVPGMIINAVNAIAG